MIRSEHVSREWLDGSVHDVLLKAAPIVPCRSTSRIPDCTGSPSPEILRVLAPGAAASMARHSIPFAPLELSRCPPLITRDGLRRCFPPPYHPLSRDSAGSQARCKVLAKSCVHRGT
jgi:hypothetical protein